MLLGPFGLVFLLVIVDYGAWDWGIASDHGTIALIAGLAMAPLVVALTWYGALALSDALRAGARRARARFRPPLTAAQPRGRAPKTAEHEDGDERVPERLAA